MSHRLRILIGVGRAVGKTHNIKENSRADIVSYLFFAFSKYLSCLLSFAMSELPIFSLEDVAAHSSKDDLWVMIHGKGELIELWQSSRSLSNVAMQSTMLQSMRETTRVELMFSATSPVKTHRTNTTKSAILKMQMKFWHNISSELFRTSRRSGRQLSNWSSRWHLQCRQQRKRPP